MSHVLTLAYHAVTPAWSNPLAMDPQTFELQISKLAERGYTGVTFTKAALEPAERPVVAITFDDAFASVAEWAVPTLRKQGWPATVFAVTQAVDNGGPMWWLVEPEGTTPDRELLPLTWDQLADLSLLGWEIGSHSRTHRLLSRLSDEDLHAEVAGSRQDVVEHLGSCLSFSYPWGVLSPRAIEAAGAAGYVAASGLTGRFLRHNPLAVPRFAIASTDDELRFRMKTSSVFARMRSTPIWDVLGRVRPQPAYPR
jgi:peptidoglycan/xylan/chitin deacetylase (PgdA/CDA1 family)